MTAIRNDRNSGGGGYGKESNIKPESVSEENMEDLFTATRSRRVTNQSTHVDAV